MYINDDTGLTLIYTMARSNWTLRIWNGKKSVVVLCYMKMHSDSTSIKFRSLSLRDLCQRTRVRLCQYFQRNSPLKLPILLKSHMQPPGIGGKKVYILSSSHGPRWLSDPYMVKKIKHKKNLLLQYHQVDCLETRYVTFGSCSTKSI